MLSRSAAWISGGLIKYAASHPHVGRSVHFEPGYYPGNHCCLQYVTNMSEGCLGFVPILPHKLTLHIPFAKCQNRNLAPSNKLSKRTLLPMSEYHLRLTSFCNGIATTVGSPNIPTQIYPWLPQESVFVALDIFGPVTLTF